MQSRGIVLVCGVLFSLLAGCAHAPVPMAPAPLTTQDACRQIREFFKTFRSTSDAPEEMSAGCHMHMIADERASDKLDRHLASNGWTRTPAYAKGTVPSEVVYETSVTRCAILKLVDSSSGGGSISGGIGIGGGSHFSTGVGIGLGVGSPAHTQINYKIDCLPRNR